MKKIKKTSESKMTLKVVYLLLVLAAAFLLIYFLSNLFNKYYTSFDLSEELSDYRRNISLEQIDQAKASRVINLLHPTTTPPVINIDRNPFASQSVQPEEE